MDVKTIAGGIGAAAAGVAAIFIGVSAAANAADRIGWIVIGVSFLAATAIALIAGATAKPVGSPPPKASIGGKFLGVPDRAFWLIVVILVIGLVLGGILLAI
jgi:hypothetical protein